MHSPSPDTSSPPSAEIDLKTSRQVELMRQLARYVALAEQYTLGTEGNWKSLKESVDALAIGNSELAHRGDIVSMAVYDQAVRTEACMRMVEVALRDPHSQSGVPPAEMIMFDAESRILVRRCRHLIGMYATDDVRP